MIQRTINGSANQVDWTFDALGRVTSEENLLGEFTYTYDGVTNRLATVTYPNDQTSTYGYLDDENDHRLQTIHHKYPNTSTLSKFDYTYDVAGNILTWRQQADSTAVMWKYSYDPADQLSAAVKHATDTGETVLKRYAYAYDPAGNRTVEQIDDAITLSAYDNLNRFTSQAPGGPMVIAGSLNEPGTVTISGVRAVVDGNNNFRGTVPTTSGTNAFTIVAKDASGNITTQQYEVELSGSSKTFTYDANGNLTADGTRSFEWDARNQFVAIEESSTRVDFTYDGRRRRIEERRQQSGVVVSSRQQVWCDEMVCEVHDGASVERKRFTEGEQFGSTLAFTTTDHLGSPTDVVSSAGNLLTRYSFDPFGERQIVSGSDTVLSGFGGQLWNQATGLWLTKFRAYSPSDGRWLSEDPLGIEGGLNLYSYANRSPITLSDPTGLVAVRISEPSVRFDALSSEIGGCGRVNSGVWPGGVCECKQDGSFAAVLSIDLAGRISVAKDLYVTPKDMIYAHERRHWNAKVAAVHAAAVAGIIVAARSFSSKSECEAAKDAWISESRRKVRAAGGHGAEGFIISRLTCF